MNATDQLRNDHKEIQRLEKIITRCYILLDQGRIIPLIDIEKITNIIEEFLDSIHYYREENSYFACVSSYDIMKKEIRTFLIEHEFGRRIAHKISFHIQNCKNGKNETKQIARFLKTYSIYLNDHISKENKFFDAAEKIISKEEEQEMFEKFQSLSIITKKITELITEINYLEARPWMI